MEIIMSNQDAIITALNNGLPAVEKKLLEVANVSNGGKLTEQDQRMLDAAKKFMDDEDSVAVARRFQQEIEMLNRLIKERDVKISRLQRENNELEELEEAKNA